MDNIPTQKQKELEINYVKNTYDNIAGDFSKTRYKKWPKVDEYLKSIDEHSLLLDVGCGNGKYLDNSRTFNVGCDISSNLLSICKQRDFEVLQCDMSAIPFRPGSFDAIICIAALHHIASSQRRRKCLEKMISLLRPSNGSSLLVQVWAFEQDIEPNNRYLKSGKKTIDQTSPPDGQSEDHVVISGDLKLLIHKNRTPFQSQELLVPFKSSQSSTQADKSGDSGNKSEASQQQTSLRYYHLFKADELESMIRSIHGAELVKSFYDQGNWCAIISRSS